MNKVFFKKSLSPLGYMVFAVSLFSALPVHAQYRELAPIHLYKGPVPGTEDRRLDNEIAIRMGKDTILYNVENPTITPFIPDPDKSKGMAMLVCPGGGYQTLSITSEGSRVCRWLAEHGITAFLLKYRIDYLLETKADYQKIFNAQFVDTAKDNKAIDPTESEAGKLAKKYNTPHSTPNCVDFAIADAKKALSYIRQHADELGVRPGHLGMMGFSAGARVTWNVEYDHTPETRPDVIAAIYCGIPKDTLPKDPVPFFAAAPQLDIYPDPTAYNLFQLWYNAKIPAELHYFSHATHGFGLKSRTNHTNIWIKMFYNFLINNGFIGGAYLD